MVWSTLNNFDTYEREQIVLNVVFTIKEGVIGGGGGEPLQRFNRGRNNL
jgi:hypothetical protein